MDPSFDAEEPGDVFIWSEQDGIFDLPDLDPSYMAFDDADFFALMHAHTPESDEGYHMQAFFDSTLQGLGYPVGPDCVVQTDPTSPVSVSATDSTDNPISSPFFQPGRLDQAKMH